MHFSKTASGLLAIAGVGQSLPTHQACERRVLTTTTALNAPTQAATSAPIALAEPVIGILGAWNSYPSVGQWKSFDEIFNNCRPTMQRAGNTAGATERLRASILATSQGIDPRIILAIIMRESEGSVATGGASDGQNTPGLMQAMGCPSSPGNHDASQAEISAGIACGVQHFLGDMGAFAGLPYEQQVYQALRSYNSGPSGVNPGDLDSISGYGVPNYIRTVSEYLTGARNHNS